MTMELKRSSNARTLSIGIALAAIFSFILSGPVVAQAERKIDFFSLDELPNGRIAHDAGIIEANEVKSLSVAVESPLQPVLVQLVSLTEKTPLDLTIFATSQPDSKLSVTTDETQMAMRTVTGEGELKISWKTNSGSAAYVLSVFIRDPLPLTQPVFTRQSTEFDPLQGLAQLNEPEPGLVRKLLDVISGDDASRQRQSAMPSISPDEPVGRDHRGMCTVARDSLSGQSPEQISADLKESRNDATKKNEEALNEIILSNIIRLLTKSASELTGPILDQLKRDGKGVVDNAINNSLKNLIRDTVGLSAQTAHLAAKTYVLIQKEDGECRKPLVYKMPRLPISHSQNADICRACYDAAYAQIEAAINELARVHCVYNVGKGIRDTARSAMNSAASMSVVSMPLVLAEIKKMNEQFDKVVYFPAQKRHAEELSKLETGLQDLSRCESEMVGFDGWYERFGFSFHSNMASAYQVKHD